MHELSVCQALIRQVQDIAREYRAVAVTSVKLQIGPLSGVEPDLLKQAFPLASAGSVAQTAQSVIEKLPIRVRCESCGAETAAEPNKLVCGACRRLAYPAAQRRRNAAGQRGAEHVISNF